MYQLISAIGRSKTPGSAWRHLDLTELTVGQLNEQLSEAYIVLASPLWQKNRCAIYTRLRPQLLDHSLTLEQSLVALGTESFPTQSQLPKIENGKVVYADAYWAGYRLRRAKYSQNPEVLTDPMEADCLVMEKKGVDPHTFYKHCLVSINGMIHRTDRDDKYIYVMEAQKSAIVSMRNEVGIINFKGIGSLEFIDITPDMIHRRTPDQPMANQMYIKSPKNSAGKTVALVFGGYLHLLDSLSFSKVADDIFMFDVQSLPMLERYFESSELINLNPLGLDLVGANKKQLARQELMSDEVLTKWACLSQSFLIYIDSDNIDMNRVRVQPSTLCGEYVSYTEPTAPMLLGFGLLAPYWKSLDEGQWSMSVGDNIKKNYLFRSAPDSDSPAPADNCIPHYPKYISEAYMLEITAEVMSFYNP